MFACSQFSGRTAWAGLCWDGVSPCGANGGFSDVCSLAEGQMAKWGFPHMSKALSVLFGTTGQFEPSLSLIREWMLQGCWRMSFCHILLAKASHRTSPNIKDREIKMGLQLFPFQIWPYCFNFFNNFFLYSSSKLQSMMSKFEIWTPLIEFSL